MALLLWLIPFSLMVSNLRPQRARPLRDSSRQRASAFLERGLLPPVRGRAWRGQACCVEGAQGQGNAAADATGHVGGRAGWRASPAAGRLLLPLRS